MVNSCMSIVRIAFLHYLHTVKINDLLILVALCILSNGFKYGVMQLLGILHLFYYDE